MKIDLDRATVVTAGTAAVAAALSAAVHDFGGCSQPQVGGGRADRQFRTGFARSRCYDDHSAAITRDRPR